MRRRLLGSMVAVTVLAVVLFGVPLGVAAAHLYRGREVSRLQQDATRAAGALPAGGLHSGDPIRLPPHRASVHLALYDETGRRVVGVGPAQGDTEVANALRGRVNDDHDGGSLAVAVPVHDEERIVGAARAAIPWDQVARATHVTWLLMAALGVAAVLLAGGLAWHQSTRLLRPVESVAALAVRLGEGDFGARMELSAVTELDRAAEALNRTAARLGDLVARERAFTTDVSHQLNTPLTSLRLGLESSLLTPDADAAAAIERAVTEVERLQATVATLLAVARDVQPLDAEVFCDVAQVCHDIANRCRGALAVAGRPLHTDIDTALPAARCPAEILREILAVLVENAGRHGAGIVTIVARRAGSGVVVDVADEGEGITGDVARVFRRRSVESAGHGIGLALARSLAEAHGARLTVTRAAPRPIFTVALPGAQSSN